MTVLDATSYGLATGNTGAANQTALGNWWTALNAASPGTHGYIPGGTYNIAGNNIWDFQGSRSGSGIHIYGDGMYQTKLNFTATTGTGLQFKCTGGGGPTTLVGYYYNNIHDICFIGNTSGMAFKLGKDDGSDSIQGSLFENLIFSNGVSNSGGGLRINGATQNTFINVQATAYPATVIQAGSGVGCEIVMGSFNSFIGCAFSNANTGILFSDLGSTGVLGFSYSNTFINMDIENTQYCVKNTSPAASRNRFISGAWYTIYAGGYAVSSTTSGNPFSGSCLIIEDVNMGLNPLYGTGGTSPALDPNNQVGVLFKGGAFGVTTTPPLTSGTTVTNKTGQTQFVVWSGTLTNIQVNGVTLANTVNSAMLAPSDTIKLTGTSLAWYWRNVIN